MSLRGGALATVLAVLASTLDERSARSEAPPRLWVAATSSPVAIDEGALDALEGAALHRCGVGERGLGRVARELLVLKSAGARLPEPDEIAFAQRAAGEPHPWARAWTARGRGPNDERLLSKLKEWLGQGGALRRCGVASGTSPDGGRVLVVVAVEALADLAPLPTAARVGQWLTVDAHMRTPAKGAKVIVLGPSGAPLELLTSVDQSTVRARFAPDRVGAFTVQVMADVAAGPRPVLEARVYAGTDPTAAPYDDPAPGEDVASTTGDDVGALVRMLSAARDEMGLPSLRLDPRLDTVAQEHCLRMKRGQLLAHDAGDGDPLERVEARGLGARLVGENVTHAPTLIGAHRALWASPSHRLNMLRPEFRRVGIGVARGDQGDVWVTELFLGD
jgi:uncharacterized protein YkwD